MIPLVKECQQCGRDPGEYVFCTRCRERRQEIQRNYYARKIGRDPHKYSLTKLHGPQLPGNKRVFRHKKNFVRKPPVEAVPTDYVALIDAHFAAYEDLPLST
jgi:hypothetical protein